MAMAAPRDFFLRDRHGGKAESGLGLQDRIAQGAAPPQLGFDGGREARGALRTGAFHRYAISLSSLRRMARMRPGLSLAGRTKQAGPPTTSWEK